MHQIPIILSLIGAGFITTHQYHCHFFTRFCDDLYTPKDTVFVLNIVCILFKNVFREIKVFVVSLRFSFSIWISLEKSGHF